MSLITIIIPVYNVEKYIRQALDSLVNQTLTDIEILCVVDCSPDNSISILKEYAKRDSRFKIIELDENMGQGYARNIAIEKVTSEYFMFLDPDDWYELDTCEKAYNQISKNDNDFLIFDFSRFYAETSIIKLDSKYSETFNQLEKKFDINPKDCNFQFFLNAFVWNKIYKTSFIKENKILFSTHRFLEDLPFSIKVFVLANSFSFIPESLYFYRKKANENMTLNYTEYYSHVIDSHRENYLYVENSGNENLIKNYLVYTIKSTLHWFDNFEKINKNIKNDFYRLLYSYFSLLNDENDISKLSKEINLKEYQLIIKNKNLKNYDRIIFFRKVLKKLFSISNTSKGKILSFLFIEIILKKKDF